MLNVVGPYVALHLWIQYYIPMYPQKNTHNQCYRVAANLWPDTVRKSWICPSWRSWTAVVSTGQVWALGWTGPVANLPTTEAFVGGELPIASKISSVEMTIVLWRIQVAALVLRFVISKSSSRCRLGLLLKFILVIALRSPSRSFFSSELSTCSPDICSSTAGHLAWRMSGNTVIITYSINAFIRSSSVLTFEKFPQATEQNMTGRGKNPSAKFVLESIAFIFESTWCFRFRLELLDFDSMCTSFSPKLLLQLVNFSFNFASRSFAKSCNILG